MPGPAPLVRAAVTPRMVIVWLLLLVGITSSSVQALIMVVLGTSVMQSVGLWSARLLILAAVWILPASRSRKFAGSGLIAAAMVLDLLLKMPVLGGVEYGDWFLITGLDLSGQYGGYMVTCGLLLPVLAMTGWFIARGRRGFGWIAGLAASLGMGMATWSYTLNSDAPVPFILLTLARFAVPAWLAVTADALASRFLPAKTDPLDL